ncbi:MAG: DUF488 family protein [Lachnoclostridium sp.]|nr:DUF488 family protein [Lachnoclostridium sp.]
MTEIALKRAYDPADAEDGFRVYIDRLWPRGLSHATFHYDLWDKEIAPSTELREWFHADPDNRWDEFEKKYLAELANNPGAQQLKTTLSSHTKVTLLYSSHDHDHNNAVVLKQYLE